ncbi:V4R domain-containing protein [Gloeothece verrucosa]|uniref:4-vinyl reductase 4VR n=1 Tax=Gloeothece verrucosa (strain PCC 7822) TaxID=497965 RepID=E0U647_GLOV7|nr:V4R domain-containing protein [Gloeothece verrucosa]ADN12383.1 4-vinyl reductase 4VR [Gloeothece verrucosa PCC 7822]
MVFISKKPGIQQIQKFNRIEPPLKKKYPKKHDHFGLDEFFYFNTESGSITDWNRCRNILTSEDFIIGLIEGLEEEVGNASGVVMYQIGKQWGLRDAEFFKGWFDEEYEYDMPLSDMNISYVLEAWWWPFTTQGWGNWDIDLSEQKNGFMFVNIYDSAVARTLGDVGKPVCHIYAGLMAGFFSSLIQKELSCIEIQCYSMGETFCKFLLGKKDRIDAATFWQNEGATAKDIEKRLVNGEYLK